MTTHTECPGGCGQQWLIPTETPGLCAYCLGREAHFMGEVTPVPDEPIKDVEFQSFNLSPENPEGLVPCPTCEGGGVGFGQTNAGIFKRCPQCEGRTEVPQENPEGLVYPTYSASHAPSGVGPHYCIQPDGSRPLHIGDQFIQENPDGQAVTDKEET